MYIIDIHVHVHVHMNKYPISCIQDIPISDSHPDPVPPHAPPGPVCGSPGMGWCGVAAIPDWYISILDKGCRIYIYIYKFIDIM